MLKKWLYMLVICCSFVYFPLISPIEQDISYTHQKEIIALSSSVKEQDIEEDEFVDSYEQQPLSKTEKLVALMAPYLMKVLPYYLCMCAHISAMKLRAVLYYKSLIRHAS